MRRKETPATPPKATLVLAKLLPKKMKFIACGCVHTIGGDYGNCTVCGRDWTEKDKRQYLRVNGTRSPYRDNRPSELSLNVYVFKGVRFHRGTLIGKPHWTVSWTHKGDFRSANVKPWVSFSYRNISHQERIRKAEIAREIEWEKQQELEDSNV